MYNSDGYLSNLGKDVLHVGFEQPHYTSSYYISDGSFVKIDYISAGFTFYELFSKKSKVRLFTTWQNIYTFTRYKGIDPEWYDGVDYFNYPRPQNIIFGVNIDF
jgi:iron complex outermembrane receptor protein